MRNGWVLYLAVSLLFPAAAPAQQAQEASLGKQTVVWGTVRDSVQGIPFASVFLKGNPRIGVRAEEDGSFWLPIDKSALPDTLVFSTVGYRNAYFPLSPQSDTLQLSVRLRRSDILLKDVVVKARKNDWKKLDRQSAARFNDALLTSAIHERRFVFRIEEMRPLRGRMGYMVMPGVNYMIVERDSIEVHRSLAGATYTDNRGNFQIVDYVPDYAFKVPVVSFQETENKGGIQVAVNYIDPQGDYTQAIFTFANYSGASLMTAIAGKVKYSGYVEVLGYPAMRKEWLQTLYEKPGTEEKQ